jgi:hypothetical protein
MLWWYMTCNRSEGSAPASCKPSSSTATSASTSAAESSPGSPTSATSAIPPAAETTAAIPAAETAAAIPVAETTTAIPAAETTAAIPAAETTTAIPAAETTSAIPAAETTVAITSSPAAAAESAFGPISPAAKHRVIEAGSALGRRRPVFIVSALESTLGLKTAEVDGLHAVATGVELAKLAHHLYEESLLYKNFQK